MTNWIVGHTDRFKAAVTQRSVTNLISFVGTSDFGYLFNYELGDFPWTGEEALKKYLHHSPIWYVKNIKTPLLIIHAEEDYRCPISQAEELFVALKVLGREVKLVRFPNENHELSRSGKPKHRIERLKHIVKWFEEKLK
jgi:dipeptidyl aminopeptidase/acylaminoacyl peptidase